MENFVPFPFLVSVLAWSPVCSVCFCSFSILLIFTYFSYFSRIFPYNVEILLKQLFRPWPGRVPPRQSLGKLRRLIKNVNGANCLAERWNFINFVKGKRMECPRGRERRKSAMENMKKTHRASEELCSNTNLANNNRKNCAVSLIWRPFPFPPRLEKIYAPRSRVPPAQELRCHAPFGRYKSV